jgi:capsular exopolysaccharide synthesis family protein
MNDAENPGSQPALDFRQRTRWIWRVIWRGKPLILACLLLILVPVILFLQQATKRYTAEAKIVIEAPETADILADRGLSVARQRLSEAVVQTEADLIASSLLARRVVARLHLDTDPEFNLKLRDPRPLEQFLAALNPLSWIPESWLSSSDDFRAMAPSARTEMELARITRRFAAGLSVRAQRRSYIISVQYTAESREKAALIANTVAELYVLDRLEASFDEARRVSGWLGERLEILQKDLAAAEAAVEDFRSKNGLRRRTERQTTVSDQQLSELNSRLVLARADMAQKQARLDQVRTLVRTRGSVDTSSDVLQSLLIQRMREQESSKSRELSEAIKTYGDRHPRIVGLRADLDELRAKIAMEIERIATSMGNDLEVSSAGVASLERELNGLRRQSNVAGEAEIRLRELERQAEASKSLYEAFLARFKREAEQERMQRANARIVSTAEIPLVHSFPPSRSILGLAVLMALLGGAGLVLLLERLDNAVRSADDAEALTGLPTLAMIPLQRTRTGDRPIDMVLERPHSALADGVRSLRTALDIKAGSLEQRVIVVTSSVPKEGKTFVSLCLAFLFAKVEERVLLIDGDVYRPRLHAALGLECERGLTQVLNGEASFDEVVVPKIAGLLDFLPVGRVQQATDMLQAQPLEELIAELARRYDRIVIDTPPVLAVADTRVLARLADQVVYLVKWNATPRDAVRNGIKLLRGAGANLFGIALSQVDQRKHSRYGYGDYGHYYGRYQDYYGESGADAGRR